MTIILSGQPSVSKYPLYLSGVLGQRSSLSGIASSSLSTKDGTPGLETPILSGQPSVSANPL